MTQSVTSGIPTQSVGTINNLFWDKDRWSLIDLDAMRQHSSDTSFAPAYAKDRARFMRNWSQDSALYKLIDQRLPKRV